MHLFVELNCVLSSHQTSIHQLIWLALLLMYYISRPDHLLAAFLAATPMEVTTPVPDPLPPTTLHSPLCRVVRNFDYS